MFQVLPLRRPSSSRVLARPRGHQVDLAFPEIFNAISSSESGRKLRVVLSMRPV